jgi:hypothetical protein
LKRFFIEFSALFIAEFSDALRMIEVRVPNYTVKDNTVKLECHYDMEDEKLYSVKWYKDGHEFYRYLPRDHPPATLFTQNGITVDVSCNFNLMRFQARFLPPSILFY